VIGADIARFGSDKTVFAWRKGKALMELKDYNHMDTMATSQVLNTYMGMHPAAACNIDEIGVGAGVTDRVKQLNPMKLVQGINVGNTAHNSEMFINTRAEAYWALRERFITGDIAIPNDEQLMSELANIKYKFTPKGQIQIESKEDMKKRGLHSPDRADSVMLAFMQEKRKPSILQYIQSVKK
jgi:hypothetical protein